MKKTLLFLSMFAWLWVGMACSGDDDLPPIEEKQPIKSFFMNEGDSLALAVSLRPFGIKDLDKFIDSEWEYVIDDIKYHQYYYQGVVFNTLWDTKENIYRLWRIAVEEPELLPDGYFLSPALKDLKRLSHLEIRGDERATGVIPKEIFDCPLVRLHISGKGFTGAIPKEIAKVANTLVAIEIVSTSLNYLPEEIGELRKVNVPYLCYNEFRGTPPMSLRNFSSSAQCQDNYFDEIDWNMFLEFDADKSVVTGIYSVPLLDGNCLTGEIPQEVLDSEYWTYFAQCLGRQRDGYGFSNWSK
ncbi:MAG: hypothetical protein E7098_06065 [Mediterranea massiliensis]|nr:hypothetical protein [Mediterranea massiliensis]